MQIKQRRIHFKMLQTDLYHEICKALDYKIAKLLNTQEIYQCLQ